MSVKTTYTCDRCGKTQDRPEQFWVVKVMARTFDGNFYDSGGGPMKQWCRTCGESFGLFPCTRSPVPPDETMTFEDLVREIVREEIKT